MEGHVMEGQKVYTYNINCINNVCFTLTILVRKLLQSTMKCKIKEYRGSITNDIQENVLFQAQ